MNTLILAIQHTHPAEEQLLITTLALMLLFGLILLLLTIRQRNISSIVGILFGDTLIAAALWLMLGIL